jgi:hypothetical protein
MTVAARSEMLAGQLPNDSDDRAMVHAKPFTVTDASLGYRIVDDGKHGRLEWTGASTITAHDLLCAPTRPVKIEEAKEFLKTALAKGSVEQNKLLAKAEDEGISKRTLDRAKKVLEVNPPVVSGLRAVGISPAGGSAKCRRNHAKWRAKPYIAK